MEDVKFWQKNVFLNKINWMKKLFLVAFFMTIFLAKTQVKDKIYLIKENDSTLIVKDVNNKEVIPRFKINWFQDELKKEITTDLILIQENFIDYKIYDRNGKFLFKPSVFDFSVEFSEGHFAFEENGKQGLANKEGKKVIAAEYDYMGFLNHGVVQACKDCYWDRSKDEEHPPLVGGTWYWLDKNGEVLGQKKYNEQIVESEFYDVSFKYNSKEKEIVENLNIYLPEISRKLKMEYKRTCIELVYSPTLYSPYYHLKIFEKRNYGYSFHFDSDVFTNFYFDPKTNRYFAYYEKYSVSKKNGEEYFRIKTFKQSLKKWLKNKKVTLYQSDFLL